MKGIQRVAVSALLMIATPLIAQQPQTQSPAEWQRKHEIALQHRTAWELYVALKAASSSQTRAPLPDWSGLWTSSGGGTFFGAAPGGLMPKLTPKAAAQLKAGAERNAQGLSYDENLSECGPAGHPRWVREPFLRDFALTPSETWLINEMVNEIRRVYTDGRDHPQEADRYPLPEGDSIGFWDGQRLVIHTNQLMARSMGRNQPEQSDQIETVEVWEKVDPRTILLDLWIYDPALYVEPWYLQRRYSQISNPDRNLRIRYWNCSENPNNAVIKTKDGSTEFKELRFTDKKEEGGRK